MALSGRFGETSGRPFVEGLLVLPRLGKSATVSFLVDTGADGTFLMPSDALTLRLDYGALRPPVSGGISASSADTAEHKEPAVVLFTDGSDTFGYYVEIGILPWDPRMQGVPSLLGRDVLHRWRMEYDFEGQRLLFDVHSADVLVPPPGSSPAR